MQVRYCRVGPYGTNCYMAADEKGCVVIDPGAELGKILDMLAGRVPEAILLTHRHQDHTGALLELQELTGAPVYAHALEAEILADPSSNVPSVPGDAGLPITLDRKLEEGDVIQVGDMAFTVLHTSGHTAGSVCYLESGSKVLFSGDTLFQSSCGRTDFPGGDPLLMAHSLQRLSRLEDDIQVLPGHGASTSIGEEKVTGLLRNRSKAGPGGSMPISTEKE